MLARSNSPSARTTPRFELTPRQAEATKLLGGPARHIMLRGGSRSGKTFTLCRAIVVRALKAPGSTHVVLRFRFNHLKQSVIEDTFPKVFSLCFPGLPYSVNKTDWYIDFPNGSRILFGGLDDKDRTEKILGQEHSTIYLNEASQISYGARNKAVTRLAQNSGLALKAYYDCNPPSMGHWTFRLFMLKVEPTSGAALTNPDSYTTLQMNPGDNLGNLPPEYIEELSALPEKERRRFLMGEFQSQVDGALWTLDLIGRKRERAWQTEDERDAIVRRMQRIVVGVDPSGCSGPEDTRSDEIGIVVCGRDHQGQGFVLEDTSGRYSPEGWARASVNAFERWQADAIVAEKNFGGAMVESTIRMASRTAPVKLVNAARGKTVRAEPVAALYEQGKITHVGILPDLEDQMCEFSTAGYQGSRSPDRADAKIWALTDLMVERTVSVMDVL